MGVVIVDDAKSKQGVTLLKEPHEKGVIFVVNLIQQKYHSLQCDSCPFYMLISEQNFNDFKIVFIQIPLLDKSL